MAADVTALVTYPKRPIYVSERSADLEKLRRDLYHDAPMSGRFPTQGPENRNTCRRTSKSK